MTKHAEIAAVPPEVLATFRAAPSAEVVDTLVSVIARLEAERDNRDAQWRELIDADRGYDVVRNLDERVRKLYMSLNAEARGDKVDIEGDPVAKWNHLVEATATVLTYAVAQGRWAVLEHRRAEAAEAEIATLREAAEAVDQEWIARGDGGCSTKLRLALHAALATPTATAGVLDSLIEHERWNSGRVDPTATTREGGEG